MIDDPSIESAICCFLSSRRVQRSAAGKIRPMDLFATRAGADDAVEQYLPPAICSALIALPFLFPFAAGPSVNVWQQLASWKQQEWKR